MSRVYFLKLYAYISQLKQRTDQWSLTNDLFRRLNLYVGITITLLSNKSLVFGGDDKGRYTQNVVAWSQWDNDKCGTFSKLSMERFGYRELV